MWFRVGQVLSVHPAQRFHAGRPRLPDVRDEQVLFARGPLHELVVIAVKLEYGLSVYPAERDALERLLAGGGAELSCVAADTTSPTVAISSEASAPVTGPFPISVAFSEPVTGVELADLVVGNGSASELQGNNATLHRDDHARGLRCRNGGHRGRRGAGQRRQPERGGRPVLDRRGSDPGAGSTDGRRDRACGVVVARRRAPVGGELTADPGPTPTYSFNKRFNSPGLTATYSARFRPSVRAAGLGCPASRAMAAPP